MITPVPLLLKDILGSFSNKDGDGRDETLLKMYLCFTFRCRCVNLFSRPVGLKTAQTKHAPTTFNLKRRYEKLAIAVHVLQNTQRLVISRCSFIEDCKEMYQGSLRTCTAIVLLIKPFVS